MEMHVMLKGRVKANWILAVLTIALVSLACCDSVLAKNDGRGNCSGCHGPALSTTPADGLSLDFGNTLVNLQTAKSFVIKNTGGNDGGKSYRLSGTFPASSGEFLLSGSASFANLSRNATVSRVYNYKPTSRGPDSKPMTSTGTPSDYPAGVTYSLLQGSSTVTFTGNGVAPISAVNTSGTNVGNVRMGTWKNARVTVQNTGNGNLSGQGAVSNLTGTAGAGSGGFIGAGGAISVADNGSQNFYYSFAPSARGTKTANVTLSMTNGKPDETNQAHQISVQLSGNGVGPQYDSSYAPGSTIVFDDAKGPTTRSMQVSNLTPDLDLGALTDLTILSAVISGPDADMFSVVGFTPNTVLSKADSMTLDLFFDSLGQKGDYNATLTVSTDEGVAFGAPGASFQYSLTGDLAAVPEPSTLALLLVSAGLAVMIRRRRSGVKT